MKVRMTEYLDIDLESEMWCCHVCSGQLIGARQNYKRGCLVYERDPKDFYPPILSGRWTFTVADGYGLFVEFYCPHCGTMFENELLPEGFPPTWDIEVDLDALKLKVGQ